MGCFVCQMDHAGRGSSCLHWLWACPAFPSSLCWSVLNRSDLFLLVWCHLCVVAGVVSPVCVVTGVVSSLCVVTAT